MTRARSDRLVTGHAEVLSAQSSRRPPLAEPLVSVVTPSYNQSPFLGATLRSVAEQDYPHIEHIIMDGGSTDGSVEIIQAWAAAHDVRWVSERDGGQADAIQRGIGIAKGEIVAWLNSDDIYLDPRAVSDVVAQFGEGVDAVTAGGWFLSEAGLRVERIPVFPARIDFKTLRHVDWILQPATFVRRDMFLQFPIDTTLHYAFDWDLFVRMSREIRFKPLDRDVAGYRVHPLGKTVSGAGGRQRELLIVTRRYNSRFSARYALLRAVVSGHLIADKSPRPVQWLIRGMLNRVTLLTHLVTNGRGIQS